MTAVRMQCSERVYRAGNFGGSPCFRNATVEADGKWFCTQHSPEAKEKRRKDQRARWAAEREASDRRYARQVEDTRRVKLFPDLLEALEGLYDGVYGARDKAQAAIKAAREG